jgi:nitroimidazol reductase NimA-like FMN-containing flavoprotein (pyridoxamine 5'-phosphate oxidase superfamily)
VQASDVDRDPVVVPLDDAECRALLLAGRTGRLAYTRNALPAIEPVAYRVHGGDVVIPAPRDSPIVPRVRGAVVALGVDAYDGGTRTGWSVTVTGPSRTVDDPAELAVLEALFRPVRGTTPGRRYVAVRIGMLSGWRTEPPGP